MNAALFKSTPDWITENCKDQVGALHFKINGSGERNKAISAFLVPISSELGSGCEGFWLTEMSQNKVTDMLRDLA